MNNNKTNAIRLTIEKLGGEGVGIARHEGKTIFVPYSVPQDIVEAEMIQDKKNFSKAKIINVVKESPYRIKPFCKYFGTCGGCSYQNIKYDFQLKFKHDLLNEIFRKHIKPGLVIQPVEKSKKEYKYRNKMMIHCFSKDGRKLYAGFNKFNTHEIINIDHCPLHSDSVNEVLITTVRLLNEFKISAYNPQSKRGFLKDIVIRESSSTGGLLLILVINDKNIKNLDKISKILFNKHKKLTGFYTYYNPHDTDYVFKDSEKILHNSYKSPLQNIYGDIIVDKITNIRFKISPISFFQINTGQAENITEYIRQLLVNDSSKNYSIIDAYAGTGTMSLPLAKDVKSVFAIEFVNNAAMLGKENAVLNKIKNYYSTSGDAAREIKKLVQKYDVEKIRKVYKYIILDPPRAGLNDEIIGLLCLLKLKKIIYISCNPIVQARDIEKIIEKADYEINSIRPFDMFPQTFHIENVVELTLN